MPLDPEAPYTCPVCFEQSYVGVDPSGGKRQRFVEDCPVCCRPIEFEIAIGPDGEPEVRAATEAA